MPQRCPAILMTDTRSARSFRRCKRSSATSSIAASPMPAIAATTPRPITSSRSTPPARSAASRRRSSANSNDGRRHRARHRPPQRTPPHGPQSPRPYQRRRIALVLEGENFLVATHCQTSLAVSPRASSVRACLAPSFDHLVGACEQHRFVSLTRSSMVLDCLAIAVSVLLSAGIRNAWAITLGSSPAQGRLVRQLFESWFSRLHTFIRMSPGGRTAEYETAERAHERPEPCCYREQRDSGASRSMGSNRLVLFPPLRR